MSEDLNRQIAKLEVQVEHLQSDMSELKADIKAMSAAINKWKGAGALLLIFGAVFGFIVETLLKMIGR